MNKNVKKWAGFIAKAITCIICTALVLPSYNAKAATGDYIRLTGNINVVNEWEGTASSAVASGDASVSVTLAPGSEDNFTYLSVYFTDYAGMEIEYDYCYVVAKNSFAPDHPGSFYFYVYTPMQSEGGGNIMFYPPGATNPFTKPYRIIGFGQDGIIADPDNPSTAYIVPDEGLRFRFYSELPAPEHGSFSLDFDVYFTDDPDFKPETLKVTGANVRAWSGDDRPPNDVLDGTDPIINIVDAKNGIYRINALEAGTDARIAWRDLRHDIDYKYCFVDILDGQGTFNLYITNEYPDDEGVVFGVPLDASQRGLFKCVDTASGWTDENGMILSPITNSYGWEWINGIQFRVISTSEDASITFTLYFTDDPNFGAAPPQPEIDEPVEGPSESEPLTGESQGQDQGQGGSLAEAPQNEPEPPTAAATNPSTGNRHGVLVPAVICLLGAALLIIVRGIKKEIGRV